MIKYKYLHACCALFFVLAIYVPSLQAAIPSNRIVAVVNGEMISQYDLELTTMPQIIQAQLSPKEPKDKARIDQILKAELNLLIDEIIIAQEAEREGINITDATTDAEFDRLHERAGFVSEEELAKQGITIAAMKQKIRNGLLRNQLLVKMVARKIVVTEKDIDNYLAANPSLINQDLNQRVVIGLLVYPVSADAKSIAKRILLGSLSFEGAVKEFSVGPNTLSGGNIGEISWRDLDSNLRDRLSPLEAGQITPLFEFNGMQTQAKLLARKDAKDVVQGDVDLNREMALTTLRNVRSQERFKEYMEQLRTRAVIDNRF